MLKINSFAIIGGDVRQEHLAEFLYNLGYKVNIFAVNFDYADKYDDINFCLENSYSVVLPLPITIDDIKIYTSGNENILLSDVLSNKIFNKYVFGGKPTEQILKYMNDNDVKFYDYFKLEDMTIKNAIATAEGAVSVAINNTDTTLFSSNCFVTGYGRIGKALVKILKGFGANVTVAVRKEKDKVLAEFEGTNVINYNDLKQAQNFDIVFNTVPHIVFTKPELKYLNRNTIIIDLASFPGGVDLHQAKSYGIKTITAAALPSKYSPKSAGEFIGESIINIIKGVV